MSYNYLMSKIKLIITVLVAPLVFLFSFSMGSNNGQGSFILGTFCAVIGTGVFLFIMNLISAKNFNNANDEYEKNAISLGVNPEYCKHDGGDGFIIDNTNKKLFLGTIKTGTVLEFSEISSIEWEEQSTFPHNHMIHLNTLNFDLPRFTLYCQNKSSREKTYSKLRAALGIS